MRASILNTEKLASETLCPVGTGGSCGHVGHAECLSWEELSSADLAYPLARSHQCNLTATSVELQAWSRSMLVGLNNIVISFLFSFLIICPNLLQSPYKDLGEPTQRLVPCWMPKPLPPRNQCTGCVARALYKYVLVVILQMGYNGSQGTSYLHCQGEEYHISMDIMKSIPPPLEQLTTYYMWLQGFVLYGPLDDM